MIVSVKDYSAESANLFRKIVSIIIGHMGGFPCLVVTIYVANYMHMVEQAPSLDNGHSLASCISINNPKSCISINENPSEWMRMVGYVSQKTVT